MHYGRPREVVITKYDVIKNKRNVKVNSESLKFDILKITFPLAVPPATPIRNGFLRSPLMRPPIEDEGDTRTGEFPLEVLLERRSMVSIVDRNGRRRKVEQKRCFATTSGERLIKCSGLQAGKTRENEAAAILERKKQVYR